MVKTNMKYVKTFESFKDSPVNEEILGTLFGALKGLYDKAKTAINKTKGGKEIDAIFNKYIKIINDQLASKAKVTLHLKGEEESAKKESLLTEADTAPLVADAPETPDANTKLDADALRQKQKIITQIINLQKDAAKKEMEAILTKMGGADKNPDLRMIIDNKIREFDLQLLNAEIGYLEQSGDKEAVKKLSTSRDKVSKELDAAYKKVGTGAKAEIKLGDKTFKIGKKYRYKTEDGVKTIVLSGESTDDGKVKASYTYGKTKGEEQNFTISNIDGEFRPKKGKVYNYFSDNNKKEISVTVVGEPDAGGQIRVKSGKNEFNVEVGSLLDAKE